MTNVTNYVIVFLSILFFSACGGGGGSVDNSTSTNTQTSSTKTAFLIDSKIKGMKYTCGDIEDFTGDDGSFKYTDNCNIEFKVGNIKIGNIQKGKINSDKKVYPADLAQVARENTTDEKVKKLIRVMQTLDNDNNPDNGIEIYQSTHNSLANIKQLDILSTTVSIDEIQTTLKEVNFTLKDEEEALKHYKKTLLDDLGISPLTTNIPSPSIYLNASVNENATSGTQITKIPLNYLITASVSSINITGTGYENFDVSNDGGITLSSNVALDYEKTNNYNLTIVITDTNNITVSANLKINVLNQDEIYPTLTSFNSSIDENSQEGTVVGTLQIQTNSSAIKSISLSGEKSSDFTIDTNGVIKIATGAIIDYETKGLYQLKATVENVNNNSSEVNIVININDLNENPIENPKVVAKLLASDGVTKDEFGYSVAIDGDYIIIGAPKAWDATIPSTVYVYKKESDGSIKEIQKLTASDGFKQDSFGYSVAISGDYIVIGSPYDDDNGSSSGSAYIFKNDGNDNFQEVAKVTASDGASYDDFGRAVAIDGNFVVIGAEGDDNSNGYSAGSAYIFKNDGSDNFNQIQKLTASDGQNMQLFGVSVAIENNYIVVGATYDDTNPPDNAAYVFKNDGNDNFTEIQKLIGSNIDSYGNLFGINVSIYDNYIAISDRGSAIYIFKNDGNDNFNEIQILTASDDSALNSFGSSVSMNNDYIVIGGSGGNGSTYIFKNEGNDNFTQIKKIVVNDGSSYDYFGNSVSMSGNYIVIGAKYDDDKGDNSGSAYIVDIFAEDKPYILNMNSNPTIEENTTFVADYYTESSNVSYSLSGIDSSLFNIDEAGALSFKNPPDYENPSDSNGDNIYEINVNILDNDAQKSNSYSLNITVKNNYILERNTITASDGYYYDYFGNSVAVYGDYIVVGAIHDDDKGTSSGSAYVYKKQNDGNVKEIAKLTASDGSSNDFFGYSVAINGNYIVVGASKDDVNSFIDCGSAYIFKNDGNDNFEEIKKIIASDSATSNYFGKSVAINSNYIIIGSPNANNDSVYIFNNNEADNFSQYQKLTANDGTFGDYFGISVDISDNYIIVGAYQDDDKGTNSGSVYIFKQEDNTEFTQIKKLVAEDGTAEDNFGSTVSIDGNYIIIGSSQDDDNGYNSGSSYIFKNNGSDNFEQIQKLIPIDVISSNYFGNSVSISGDYIVIGAYKKGESYLFKNNGYDNFEQIKKLAPTEYMSSYQFGLSVSIENNTVIIGSPNTSKGSAYLFQIDPNDEN